MKLINLRYKNSPGLLWSLGCFETNVSGHGGQSAHPPPWSPPDTIGRFVGRSQACGSTQPSRIVPEDSVTLTTINPTRINRTECGANTIVNYCSRHSRNRLPFIVMSSTERDEYPISIVSGLGNIWLLCFQIMITEGARRLDWTAAGRSVCSLIWLRRISNRIKNWKKLFCLFMRRLGDFGAERK